MFDSILEIYQLKNDFCYNEVDNDIFKNSKVYKV